MNQQVPVTGKIINTQKIYTGTIDCFIHVSWMIYYLKTQKKGTNEISLFLDC